MTRSRVAAGLMVAVLAAVALGAAVARAPRADAHAILIASSPTGGTTVSRPPTAVQLEFSEPVEIPFGSVHVYDVDAKRVDDGVVRKLKGGRVLSVAVRAGTGTFTAVWQGVVSADGHVVKGQIVYYVGAPSSRSPALIPSSASTPKWLTWTAGVARFLWFTAVSLLVGVVVVRRRVWRPVVESTDWNVDEATVRLQQWSAYVLRLGAGMLVLATLFVLDTESAIVSGKSLIGAASPSVVNDVLGTTFGHAWIVEIIAALVAAIVAFVIASPRKLPFGQPTQWLAVLVAALGVAMLATVYGGHASQAPHKWLQVAAVALHLGTATIWAGGLIVLSLLAVPAWDHVNPERRPRFVRALIIAFGTVALPSVVVLVVSGIVAAWGELVSVSDLWRTSYGEVLLAKIGVLVVALALAGWHRYVATRRLATEHADRAAHAVEEFETTTTAEWALLLGAFALAAALIAMVPSRAVALKTAANAERVISVGPYKADVLVDPIATGANQVHLTFTTSSGAPAAAVQQATVTLRGPGGAAPVVALQLAAAGHFVGDTTISRAGRYILTVSTAAPGGRGTVTGSFPIDVRAASAAP